MHFVMAAHAQGFTKPAYKLGISKSAIGKVLDHWSKIWERRYPFTCVFLRFGFTLTYLFVTCPGVTDVNRHFYRIF